MCDAASFIVTKGPKAFWSKSTDSHSEIRKEHGLPENGIGKAVNVQVEITPPNKQYDLPLEQWVFRTDQDTLPSWWDAKEAEKECRVELDKWARIRLVRSGDAPRNVNEGDNVIVCGGTVKSVRGGTVKSVMGGTVNEVWGGTVNEVMGGTVKSVCGGTVNEVWGGTVNEVWGGTVNEVWGGTVSFRCAFSCKLYGSLSVIINRIGTVAKCYVGTEKQRTVKGK